MISCSDQAVVFLRFFFLSFSLRGVFFSFIVFRDGFSLCCPVCARISAPDLSALELALQTRLFLNSLVFLLCLPSAATEVSHHHLAICDSYLTFC